MPSFCKKRLDVSLNEHPGASHGQQYLAPASARNDPDAFQQLSERSGRDSEWLLRDPIPKGIVALDLSGGVRPDVVCVRPVAQVHHRPAVRI